MISFLDDPEDARVIEHPETAARYTNSVSVVDRSVGEELRLLIGRNQSRCGGQRRERKWNRHILEALCGVKRGSYVCFDGETDW